MKVCDHCGGARFPSGSYVSYSGPLCQCPIPTALLSSDATELARLRDENKRLREAGNDLMLAADSWNAHQTRSAFDRFSTAVDALRAALSAAQSRES